MPCALTRSKRLSIFTFFNFPSNLSDKLIHAPNFPIKRVRRFVSGQEQLCISYRINGWVLARKTNSTSLRG